ncbi:hypothetical protein B0O99DRAFT_695388 [Bisporella sp. PMI_857]|nr:hypothetical protein B0O99DRAFT_695388 [Bisporella sp. PMI_857]
MKALKKVNMKGVMGSFKSKPRDSAPEDVSPETQLDTPEANALRCVRLFCESGGPNGSGEEVLYLPTIVESAESSPAAAKECAQSIRKYLSKENLDKPYIQYNAIMLVRILADNPGKTFTRNIDAKFVQAVKELLRVGRDPSVKQILTETLDTFQREKSTDEGLTLVIEMWKKEYERMIKHHGSAGIRPLNAPPFNSQSQNYFSRNHHSRRLPEPHELASRIEEARTSANLLSQVVQSTPPSELLYNELVREFADRCQSAQRSVQAYMIAENPTPDNNTMETLIETNEELAKAQSQHQRAILNARKILGIGDSTSPAGPSPPPRTESGFAAPPGPPPTLSTPVPPRKIQPQIPPPGETLPNVDDDDDDSRDPFRDPDHRSRHVAASGQDKSAPRPPFPEDRPPVSGQFDDRLGVEPYHPGFKETQSYVGRQDSSVDHTTMHAAATTTAEESPSGYGTQAGSKAPVYRY